MLATFLLGRGQTIDEIAPLFKNAPDYNEKITRYQIKQVAGETGLDIIEIGKDKAQILKDFTFQDKLIFFGDNIQWGGNDYGIGQAIQYSPYAYSECHNVKNWKETWKILKRFK